MEVLSKIITLLASLVNVLEILLKLLDVVEPFWTRFFIVLEEAMWFLSHVGMYYARFRSGWFVHPDDMIVTGAALDIPGVDGEDVSVPETILPPFKFGTYRPRIWAACVKSDIKIAMKNGRTRQPKR